MVHSDPVISVQFGGTVAASPPPLRLGRPAVYATSP